MDRRKFKRIGRAVFGTAKFTIFEALAMCIVLELLVGKHWFACAAFAFAAAFGSKYAENYFNR